MNLGTDSCREGFRQNAQPHTIREVMVEEPGIQGAYAADTMSKAGAQI